MRKNAFTLIELLAIIIVLGVLALVTVPAILGIIDSSKQKVLESSAYSYAESIEKFYYSKSVDDLDFEFDNRRYNYDELKRLGVSVSGKEPDENSWVDIIDNDVFYGCFQFDDYMVNIDNNRIGYVSKGKCDLALNWSQTIFPTISKSVNGTVFYDPSWVKSNPIYYNPVDNSKCNSSASSSVLGTISGCMKWYAYSESDGRINMLLDHSIINYGEWGSTNQSTPSYLLSIIDDKTATWSDEIIRNDSYSANWNYNGTDYSLLIDYSGKKARLLSAEEVAIIADNFSWSNNGNSYYFGSMAFGETDGYLYQNHDEQLRQERVSWLFDNMHECSYFGCENSESDVYAYWTSTPKTNTSNEVWGVCYAGCVDSTDANVNYIGLRPVISVSKSTIY